jgi:hypothetical protein
MGYSTATSPSDLLIPELPGVPKHLIGYVKLLRFYRIKIHHSWDERYQEEAFLSKEAFERPPM